MKTKRPSSLLPRRTFLKKTAGGPDVPEAAPDTGHDLHLGPNLVLTVADFLQGNGAASGGVPGSEATLQGLGWQPDLPDGTTGVPGPKDTSGDDVNDVVSSQGIRLGTYHGIASPHNRSDVATLATAGAERAAGTLTRPAPCSVQVMGALFCQLLRTVAVFMSASLTVSGVQSGCADLRSAAAPATHGDAIDVPSSLAYWPSGKVELMVTPGVPSGARTAALL